MNHDSEKRQFVTDRIVEVRQTISLGPMENAIFGLLWGRHGEIVPTSDLLDAMDAMNDSVFHIHEELAIYICYLRRKLRGEVTIKTHPKKGYSIV